MTNQMGRLSVFLLAATVLLSGAAARVSWAKAAKDAPQVIELSAAKIIIETNSTAGDSGFQIFLDGEGWKNVWVFDADWREIFTVRAEGGVRGIGGGTELFLETVEPEYDDLDGMQHLLDLLPEGEYTFIGKTLDGDWLVGTAELTHDVPAGPEVITPVPEPGEECAADVPVDQAVISWNPVTTSITGAPGIETVGYQVQVVAEDPLRLFSVDVPADVTMVTVSPEFLAPGTEYGFEVLTIEESGNQTITESCFETAE